MSTIEMIKSCYICKSKEVYLFKRKNNYHIYKCRNCKLIWVGGVSEKEIEALYDRSYFNSNSNMGYKNYRACEKNLRKDARNIINVINKIHNLHKSRILDIGCAYGFLLDEARKLKKCDVCGVEINNHAYNYAKNRLGLNVINGKLESSNFKSNFFDVVFLVGTIEHLISPEETFLHIKRILKPGGIVFITTIDTKGMIPFYTIKPPEHLVYFNHSNLLLLSSNLGFKFILRKTYFVNYNLHVLFNLIHNVLPLTVFKHISKIMEKCIPGFSIKIPTPEMMFIVAKDNE